jgi:hypothetical protein
MAIQDAFTQADGPLTSPWATQSGENACEIVGNLVRGTNIFGEHGSRRTDTWGAAHSSQAVAKNGSGAFRENSVRVACQSGARSYYAGGIENFNLGSQHYRIWKVVAGTFTSLIEHGSQDMASSDVVKLDIQPDTPTPGTNTLTLFVNTIQVLTITDSALTGGTPGLGVYIGAAADAWDDWEGTGEGVSATSDQEGARFGNDDGSESAHTFAAAQDTDVTAPIGSNLLARLLVDGTGDLATAAYTLRYQKNGAGGYAAVPVGTTGVGTTPLIEAADCTVSGNNTATTSWAVSHPAASTGDLLIFCIAWDDSLATTDVAEPAGPNGETLTEINATPATDSSTETRSKAWYCKATGSWSASTRTFTPTASESWSATVIKVPAGEFDATTPIGAAATSAATVTNDTTIDSPAFSAGGSDGGGRLVWFAGVDADAVSGTNPTGWTIRQSQDLGDVAHGVATRDTAVSNSESIASATWGIASDSWTSIAFVVRGPIVNNEIYIATSANIAGGGEATTARLTAPAGKTSGAHFSAGRRWDDENGSDSVDIASGGYTELEWCLRAQSPAVDGDYFDLRVYAGGSALTSYGITPRWTLGTAVVPVDAGDVLPTQHELKRKPGRGPYSDGRYARPSIDVYPQRYDASGGTEAVSPSDSAGSNAAFNSSASDAVSASDDASSAVGSSASAAAESWASTDNAAANVVFQVEASDAVASIDAATSDQRPIVSDRTGTAAPRPGRTPYSVGRYFRPRIDVFNNTFPVVGNDSVAANDASANAIVGVAAASQAVAIADTATQTGVFAASASDSVSINDIAASTMDGDRTATDPIDTGDASDAIIGGTAFAAEALALADSADTSLFSGNNLSAAESQSPADAADTAGSIYVGDASEAQLLADLAAAVKVGVFEPSANSRCRVDSKARVRKGRVGGRRI